MAHVVNQISVFLEQRVGTLAEFCEVLREAGVDMRALSLAESTDFGVARVIVDKLEVAQKALKKSGRIFSITPVVAVEIKDEAGALYKLLEVLKNANISLKYCYAVTTSHDGKAYMMIRVSRTDIDKTLELLNQ